MRNNYNVLDCVQTQSSRKTFYPTPEPIAEKMLESKDWMMIGSVLEPSAGKGDLALFAAKKLYKNRRGYLVNDERSTNDAIEGSDIDCIEIDPALRSILDDKGYRVVHDDFLTFEKDFTFCYRIDTCNRTTNRCFTRTRFSYQRKCFSLINVNIYIVCSNKFFLSMSKGNLYIF